MLLGALIDVGLPLEELEAALAKLDLAGYELVADRVLSHGLTGTQFRVDEPLEAGEGMSMQDAAMQAARGAMGRRLGGLMGRNRQAEEPEEPTGPTAQSITMRTITLVEDIRTSALSDDLFTPPDGYTERRPDWMGGR